MRAYLLVLILTLSPSSLLAQDIKIIVNEENPISSIDRDQIRDYFLKKDKQWPGGASVRFFDRMEDSKERIFFLKDIVQRSPREIETFWIGQKLYTGHSAPTQVTNNSMMTTLVARFPWAIGYVSKDYPLRKGVKEVELRSE